MHIAFGRVRRKTSPARGGTCVFIFRIHHSFKELLDFASLFEDPVRLGMHVAFRRVRRKTAPTGSGIQKRRVISRLQNRGSLT